MHTSTVLASAAALTLLGASLDAQTIRPRGTAQAYTFTTADDDRPRLGVTTGPGGKRDTLGLLVTSVTRDGPAEKAGLEEGDRLQSINGVSLRLSAVDLEDEELLGIGTRRLVRELAKVKVGDEVNLRVYREGQTRDVKIKTVAAEDLSPSRVAVSTVRRESEERASLGIGMGISGSRRDTLGVLIASVTDDGPADKARVEEGDRIAAINGVDLRVNAADAGDWSVSNSRMRRLTRELEKVKAGDEVELRLVRGGQTRTVRVKTVAAKDLPRGARGFFFGDGMTGVRVGPGGFGFGPGQTLRIVPRPGQGDTDPMIYFDRFDDGDLRFRLSPQRQLEFQDRMDEVLKRVREAQLKIRPEIHFP
jgi:S1-C subfamily serine protease